MIHASKQLPVRSIIQPRGRAEGLLLGPINANLQVSRKSLTERPTWRVTRDLIGRFVSSGYQPEPLLQLLVSSRVIVFPPATVGSDWREQHVSC